MRLARSISLPFLAFSEQVDLNIRRSIIKLGLSIISDALAELPIVDDQGSLYEDWSFKSDHDPG
jgi:hypothetical protein